MSKKEEYKYKYVKHHMMEHPDFVPDDNDGIITVSILNAFKNTVNIGDKYLISVPKEVLLTGTSYTITEKATVLAKYPNVVKTTSGFVQYFDLYQGIKVK